MLKSSSRGSKCLPFFRFVVSWVDLYYGGDDDVLQDCELQNWITDINTHGLTQSSGLCVCLVWSVSSRYLSANCRKLCFVLLFRFPSDIPHPSRSVAVCHHDGVFLFSPTCCCQLLPGTPVSAPQNLQHRLTLHSYPSTTSLQPTAGLQSLGPKLPPSHDAAATAGQRRGDRGRNHVLPARHELDLPCSDPDYSSVAARTRLCETSYIIANKTELTTRRKPLTAPPATVKVCLFPCRFPCATTGKWYFDRVPTGGW